MSSNEAKEMEKVEIRKSRGHHCYFCGVKVTSIWLLKSHVRQHIEKPFKCSVCQKSFFDKDAINKHYRTVHSEDRPYLCDFCGKDFKMKNYLTNHMRNIHDIGYYHCSVCNPGYCIDGRKKCRSYCFKCKKDGKRRTQKGELMCIHCRKNFENMEALDAHVAIHQKSQQSAVDENNERFSSLNCSVCNPGKYLGNRDAYKFYCIKCKREGKRRTPNGELLCTRCRKYFPGMASFEDHMPIHDKHKVFNSLVAINPCAVCNPELCPVNTSGLKNYCSKCKAEGKKRTRKGTLACIQCRKTFDNMDVLDAHLMKHHAADNSTINNDSLTCVVCQEMFQSGEGLAKHWLVHSQKDPFACHLCKRSYQVQADLDRHIAFRHTQVTYECGECGKTFPSNLALTQHQKNHTELRPYACSMCDSRFKQPSVLKKHMIRHDEAKPLACPKCPKRFKQTYNLNQHLLSHSDKPNFTCELCSKSFKYSVTYYRHFSVHTGEMPYSCSVCNKQFRVLDSLRSHMNIHYVDRTTVAVQTYKCPICITKNTFRTFARYNKHMIKHSQNTLEKEQMECQSQNEN